MFEEVCGQWTNVSANARGILNTYTRENERRHLPNNLNFKLRDFPLGDEG